MTTATLLCGCNARHEALGMCGKHYWSERKRAIAAGEWDPECLIPAEPVREKIEELMKQGASTRGIARASGVSLRTVNFLRSREFENVTQGTARRIMRLRIDKIQSGRDVDAIGTQRRLQALNAMGWGHEELAEELNSHRSQISLICTGRRKGVTRQFRDRVAAVYARLEMTPGPNSRARKMALRKGYAVPLLWDEGKIDDPNARPSKYAWERYQGGHKVVA